LLSPWCSIGAKGEEAFTTRLPPNTSPDIQIEDREEEERGEKPDCPSSSQPHLVMGPTVLTPLFETSTPLSRTFAAKQFRQA
jgi:hypothetical protein